MVAFNQIPSNLRAPGVFVEFDNSRAQQGPSIMEHKVLMIGQRLAAGSKAALSFDKVTDESQAKDFYGNGSILAGMVSKFLANNKVTELTCVAMDDDGSAVKATGDVDFGGTPTKAGTINLKIGNRDYRAAVSTSDTPDDIALAIQAAIAADADAYVTAAINGSDASIVDLTAKNGGVVANEIDIRLNHNDGEILPEGVTASITAMNGGTTNPDIADVIAVLSETQYTEVISAYTDTANLTALDTELEDRWGPIRQNDGHHISAKSGSFASLSAFGAARNSKQETVMATAGPNPPFEWAAAVGGQVALAAQADPARPFQTLVLSGINAPKETERFSFSERNLLLFDGVSTHLVDAGGAVRIERIISTFQTNALGAPDTSYLDYNTKASLSYMRFDFRARFSNKYPRHKLADDGTRIAPGQPIMTPKIARAEAVAIFRGWEELGLVENIDQFKRDLIVVRSETDPNRLEFILPPDVINQLRVTGAQIAFLL